MKGTMRCHLVSVRIAIMIETCVEKKRGPLYTDEGVVNWDAQ